MNTIARVSVYSIIGIVVFAAMLFLPAGTWRYWQGWAYLVLFIGLSAPFTWYLAVRAPEVLARRSRSGPVAESRPIQKLSVGVLQLAFLGMLVVAGFDHRYGWSAVPDWLAVLGLAVATGGLALTMWVVLQNAWAAATITVESGQQLVSTGLYGVVRHPMYAGAVLMAAGTPLGLASYWALLPGALVAGSLLPRIVDEEALLRTELPGYDEYTRRVRYRLLPGLW